MGMFNNRIRYLLITLVLLCVNCTSTKNLNSCERGNTSKPNFLIFLVDDLGYETLSVYGGKSYNTPNIERLAREGRVYENCYATTNCHTTRVELLTGLYPFHNGWDRFYQGTKCWDPSTFNFARMLKQNGYATAITGKWQLCLPEQDLNNILATEFDDHLNWVWGKWKNGEFHQVNKYYGAELWRNGHLDTTLTKRDYAPDFYLSFARQWISAHCNEPFLLYYPLVLVHKPFHVPPGKRAQRGQKEQALYPLMVEYMDYIVGELLDHIEKSGLEEETVIIFTSDNGSHAEVKSEYRDTVLAGGKATLKETGIRVPFIVKWKNHIPAGTRSADLIDFTDLLPTLAELSKSKLPEKYKPDGVSMVKSWLNGDPDRRLWIFSQYAEKWVIRDKRWKLTWEDIIFDLENDPYEKHPVRAADDNLLSAEARKRLKTWYQNLTGNYPGPKHHQ